MNLIMLICLWGVNTFFYNKHVFNFIFSAYYMLSSNIKASQTFTSPSSRLSGCLMDLCVIELICFALWPLYPFIFRSSSSLSHYTSIKIFQDSQNVSFSNDESDFLVWRRLPKKIRRWGAETKLFSYWDSNLYIYNNKKNCGPTIIYNDELAPRTFLIENPIFLYALIRFLTFSRWWICSFIYEICWGKEPTYSLHDQHMAPQVTIVTITMFKLIYVLREWINFQELRGPQHCSN